MHARSLVAAISMALAFAHVAIAEVLDVGKGKIELELVPGPSDLPAKSVVAWVERAAHAVTAYYGRLPVAMVHISVRRIAGRRDEPHGTTWGDGGARIEMTLGEHATQADLDGDWTMTHELVHLAFPSVTRDHRWIEEGLATYVEPFARAQAGQLSAERVWGDLVREVPQGQPERGDRGLDRTHTWARTYWGGALFALVADVRLRDATQQRLGLRDALKGILAAGEDVTDELPLERVLEIADRATGTHVLAQLYGETKDKAVTFDLSALWRSLGIEVHDTSVLFHDDAPLAASRRAMTQRSP